MLANATTPPRYLQPVIDRLEREYPNNSVVNIVCHGHSVPAGYFCTPEVCSLDSYPHLLFVALKKRFPNAVLNVIVTAIGGESSDSGAMRFAGDALSHQPDLVTIDYSLNDRRIGLASAREAWTQMILEAQRSSVKILLLTPTPDDTTSFDQPAQDLAEHRAQVIELAREFVVGVVDSFKAFQNAVEKGSPLSSLLSSKNHPNRRGHKLVRDELLQWF